MKRIFTILALATLLFVAGPAAAGTKTHKASSVTFWIPDNWTVEDQDHDGLQVSDPKGQVSLMFLLKEAKDTKAALAAIDEMIEEHATDVKAGKPQKTTLNGMETVVVDATGTIEGKPVELSVMIVKTLTGKYLTVFGVLEASVKKKHEANLVKILASLKPVKK